MKKEHFLKIAANWGRLRLSALFCSQPESTPHFLIVALANTFVYQYVKKKYLYRNELHHRARRDNRKQRHWRGRSHCDKRCPFRYGRSRGSGAQNKKCGRVSCVGAGKIAWLWKHSRC